MRSCALVLAAALAAPCLAETLTLPVTRDVGICAHPKEVALNTGGNAHIRVKGNEHYYLFDFDAAKLRARKVTKATLHLKLARGHLRKAAFCTVPCEWVEGTAVNKPQTGSTCFTHVRYPTHAWPLMGSTQPPGGEMAHTGGTMMDATFNSPHMRWEAAGVKAGKGGWLEIPIHPDLVQACAAGLSHGLVMGEEKGQTRENHDIFTREQSNGRPYLTVEARAVHVAAALDRPPPRTRELPDGRIEIDASWPMFDGKPLGHRIEVIRDIHTLPAEERATWEFVSLADPRLVPEGLPADRKYFARVTSFIGPQLHESDKVKLTALAEPEMPVVPEFKPRERMKDWSLPAEGRWGWWIVPATAKVDPALKVPPAAVVAGAAPLKPGAPVPVAPRNAWVSFQVVLYPPDGKATGVSVRVAEARGLELARVGPDYRFFSRLRRRVYRTWYVPKQGEPHAEVLVPLTGPLGPLVEREPASKPFGIPWAENKVAGQANAALLVDVYVPANVLPGRYNGRLVVSHDGKDVMDVPLAVEVAETVLPDEFHIVGDMNTYASPARAMGAKTSDAQAFMAMERKYYRLAHAHRMTLNVLPYSQSGNIHWRGAPEVKADGSLDWSEWDERYGALLDGSAFSKKAGYVGPGEGRPIHHIYVPFHENWPAPLAEHFRPWPPPRDYDAFLKWTADLPPVEKCLEGPFGDFARTWAAAGQQFRDHLESRKSTKTSYQVYLNNKHYFRKGRDVRGRAYSLWLLDEPMHADDFLALAHFARLARSVPARRADPKLDPTSSVTAQAWRAGLWNFRIDISRPTHQRNWLDGLVDLNVCADQLYSRRRFIAWRKRRFGEEYWNYRMPASFAKDNLGWALWPVRSYCWGATGTLPWQTIGSDGDLTTADATALMYPGRKFGLDEPVPSLRMKAWREGLQVAELLRLVREERKWTDVQLRAFVGQVCGLGGWKDGRDPKPDAAIVTFAGMDAGKLGTLKRAALATLAQAK
jgi:hypothetical protein